MEDQESIGPEGLSDLQSEMDDGDFEIEMFDSINAPAPFSSAQPAPFSSSGQAPEAVMVEETPPLSPEKPDHDRDASSRAVESSLPPPDATDKKNKKKSKKSRKEKAAKTGIPDSQEHDDATTGDGELFVPSSTLTAGGPVQSADSLLELDLDEGDKTTKSSKKKRKNSNAAESKRRKKRRSLGQDDPREQNYTDGASHLAAAAAFLRRSKDAVPPPEMAIEEEAADKSDPQKSPTITHLRRRSQPRSRSRENSIPPVDDADPMDVDPEPVPNVDPTVEQPGEADADAEVEALAREAWNEHRNSQNAHVDTQDGDRTPAAAEPPRPSSQRPRSTRKKAKPTFYEQPPTEPISDEAYVPPELPSPSAMTPKPRNRSKVAAKKTARGKRPKREEARDTPEDDDGEDRSQRMPRNRLVGFTQGRFSDEEIARIGTAIESFRVDHDLTQEQVNHMIHAPGGTTAGDEHAQLWLRVFAECPNRHRQKVINIARKKFHNFIARGTWTLEQDAELTDLINVHGKKWSKIAAIINRHPEDLRDRYRNYLVCGERQRKDAWDDTEEKNLTQYIIEAMEQIDELRTDKNPNRDIVTLSYEELIDWQNISERMGRTRSRLQCITKWKSLNIRTHGKDKLVSTEPDASISFRLERARRQIAAMPEEEKFRMVLAIQGTAAGKDSKIPWHRLVDKPFRHRWHRSTLMLLWQRLRQMVPGGENKTSRDCAHYLAEVYNETGELPEVEQGFDDVQEMAFMEKIPPAFGGRLGPPPAQEQEKKSAEFVVDSDVEGADVTANGIGAEGVKEDDLQIDPALTQVDVPARKSVAAKRTGSGKPPSRKKTKKAPTANMGPGPMEDEDDGPSEEQASGSDKEGEAGEDAVGPRQQTSTQSEQQPPSPHSEGSDSLMDDMDDLPARLPAV
ncbi:hypothetical protein CDD83_5602 [Cordyceps sp. RAO-2017]|nr:hypothetical protein CDD83_5602 [Cordyceps sp. RAO-2017]